MDGYKAKQLEKYLLSKEFLDYRIEKLLDNGKSAAVFKASDKNGNVVALKIFDSELIERFGYQIQEQRIQQEITLKGHSIPNLIQIIDGGKVQIETNEYYYIIMNFVDGMNFKKFITTKEYDNAFLQKVVRVLYDVTENLLNKGIVHRDIKPENIMITEDQEIFLMDLGVLKLIGADSLSDEEEKQFVGTLRYAPPEFLTRTEEDTKEGWESVNLYQIGAVLHDLIMKRELFNNITPYSNLVIAIKEDAPQISSSEYPFQTIQLARDLLVKDWKKRLELCSEERIDGFCSTNLEDKTDIEKELEGIFSLTSEHKSKADEIEKINRSNQEKEIKRKEISKQIDDVMSKCFKILQEKGLYDKFEKSSNFQFDSDRTRKEKNQIVKNVLYKLEGDISKGFLKPFFFLVRTMNDENSLAGISYLGVFLSPFIKISMNEPLGMFKEIIKEQTQYQRSPYQPNGMTTIEMYNAFDGTIGFDEQFEQALMLDIIKLIKTALNDIAPDVKLELERREKYAKGENPSLNRKVERTKMYHKIK